MSGNRPLNVLFLCTGNSARSILAEALLRELGGGRFAAASAGSHPRGAVHPLALAVLAEHGLAGDGLRSKSWTEFASGPAFDLVITVCDRAATESCPLWPGHPLQVHWGLADPAAVAGDDRARLAAFRAARELLADRIRRLVALPEATLVGLGAGAAHVLNQLLEIHRDAAKIAPPGSDPEPNRCT